MSEVLFVGKNSQYNHVCSLNLNVYLGLDVTIKAEIDDIKNYLLGALDGLKLVIVPIKLKEKSIAVEIYKFMQLHGIEVPIITLGESEVLKDHVIPVNEKVDIEELMRVISQKLNLTSTVLMGDDQSNFFPIPIKYFFFITETLVDTFVRIKRDEGDFHYILRYKSGQSYEKREIKKFLEKGVAFFYIRKKEIDKFLNEITKKILVRIKDDQMGLLEKHETLEYSQDIVADLLQTKGMSYETISIARESLKNVAKIVKKNSVLGVLLKDLLKSKTSYRYRMTQLSTFISFHIIDNLEWGSEEQQDKLAFVSFFHDIALRDDRLAKISSAKELENMYLSDEESTKAQQHARIASELVRNYPRSPLGAENIILQHHGMTNGMGYAKVFSNNLSPLSIVFIIAQAYAHEVLRSGGNKSNKEIIDELSNRFPKSFYKKSIRTLVNMKI